MAFQQFMVILTAVLLNVGVTSSSFPPPPTSASLGVEVSTRPPAFCDLMKESRPFIDSQGNEVETDENGWPTADGKLVVFDMRPLFAWAPPIETMHASFCHRNGSHFGACTASIVHQNVAKLLLCCDIICKCSI